MFGISEREKQNLIRRFPVGCMVELVEMNDSQAPPSGTRGTVRYIDDIGTVHVAWENGSSLGALYGEDIIKRVDDGK